MSENGRQRLTSWKEVAAHLGRDVRTVMRWEKDRGLPIHRLGISRRVLFAYTDELDAWSHGGLPAETPAPANAARRWLPVAVGAVIVAALVGWRVSASRASEGVLSARITEQAIEAVAPDGALRWRYDLSTPTKVGTPLFRIARTVDRVQGADEGFLAAKMHTTRRADMTLESGQLLLLSPDGVVKRSFMFDDRLTFAGGTYGARWGVTDFGVLESPNGRRIAVSTHHLEWWPSMVTVLDEAWHRRGTFVHAGWIDRVQWLSPDRLLIAGFSNVLDGGMIAALDGAAIDGQTPDVRDTPYWCTTCGTALPARYVVFPRSEVNLAAGAPFNHAVMTLSPALVVRTVEIPQSETAAADALYELTPSLEVLRASFSDRYWEAHRLLETEGKIRHTREQCPDRNGPRAYKVWEPATGWRTVAIGSSPVPSSPGRTRP